MSTGYSLNEFFNTAGELVEIAYINYLKRVDYQADLREARMHLLKLKQIDPHDLPDDKWRKAFWLNVYNLFVRYLIVRMQIKNSVMEKPWMFFSPHILVGKYKFTLDDIEHGILRRNQRTPHRFTAQFPIFDPRNQLLCHQLDYRIHFALNNGARSCPPVKNYHPATVDLELDKAEYAFAAQNFLVDHKDKLIYAAPVFKWFRSDFKDNYLDTPEYGGYKVKFLPYDWQLAALETED